MGDRGNVFVIEEDTPKGEAPVGVYLYSHWGGTELPEVVQAVLKRKQRWDDHSYLARMIFCAIVKGHEDGETGFGISCRRGDNEHDILVVDPDKQRVGIAPEGHEPFYTKSWTFEEFCALNVEKEFADF